MNADVNRENTTSGPDQRNTESPFYLKLKQRWLESDSFVCAGLDTDINKIPEICRKSVSPVFEFNKAIIDATIDLVCAYKPQIAYYSAVGAEKELEKTIAYIKKKNEKVCIILDAKRGDIGSTAERYAQEAFERYQADAVTVNPYMGGDTLRPFLKWEGKGVIVLCKTSNPGSNDFQNCVVDGEKLYVKVARKASGEWNENKNIGLVIGATYPRELQEIRELAPDIPFLVPGIGAQGGDPEKVIRNGLSRDGMGLIVNSSRAIIYASSDSDFSEKARFQTQKLKDTLNGYR